MSYEEDEIPEYTLDRYGERVYPGDYVECVRGSYMGLSIGGRRRVQKIANDTLIMRNSHSPTGDSAYQPTNFKLAGKHHPWHKEKKVAKLYVAYPIVEGQEYEELARKLQAGLAAFDADTSFTALRGRLEAYIRGNPSSAFMIFNGTTIAEISAPPVRFRDAG